MTAAPNSGKYVDFDEYVGLKLEKTQSTIRTTDLLTALAGVAAMFLGYLLAFVILDQWVIHDGFSVFWRWMLLSTLMISTITWLVYKVGIPSFRTVNGLFAAREIEKAEPQLKSNLLNLIDLKEAGRRVNPQILKSMERQAAVRLQSIDIAQVIDHRPLVHAAYLLLAVIVIFCFYALLSPKKISNSIWRGLFPAAQVPLATVTEIIDIKPGDVTIPAHQPTVNVQVDLAGEIPGQVWLLYTTADGKQDQPVELRTEQEGQPRYIGQIIGDGTQGLTHDLIYFIRAGDATSRTYKITVEQPPYADIESLRIEFPPYMKLQPIEQQKNGAIDAWEGAKVTLTAKTNMPVRSGVIQFLDEPAAAPTGEEVAMSTTHSGMQLQATWTLALRSDGSFPKYYRIHCKTEDGRVTTGHVILPLTIRPDLPPEVVLLQPDRDLEAPANATIPLLIQARDPDFELGYLYLNVEKAGQRILHDKISDGHQSKLALKHDFELSPFNPVVGDTIEFWIEAYDNKQPRPNSRNTPKVKILIVPPVSLKEAEQQLADQKERRDQKLADAEQEMNPDRRDAAPPEDRNLQDRKPRDTARPNEADPARPENPKDEPPQNGQQGQQGKKQNPSGKQGQNQGQESGASQNSRQGGAGQKQQKESENSSGEAADENKPLKNDGSQDEEVLRRINDRIKKNQSQKSGNSSDQSSSDTPRSDPSGKAERPEKEPPPGQESKIDQTPKPTENPTGNKKSDRSTQEKDKADSGGSSPEGKQPNGEPSRNREEPDTASHKPDMKNKPDMSNPDKGDKEAGTSKPETDSKNEKSSDAKQSTSNQGDKEKQGDSQRTDSEKGNSEQNDQSEKSDTSKKNGQQGTSDSMKGKDPADSKSDSQSQPKTGDRSTEQQPKSEKNETGQGDLTSEGKPSKEKSSSEGQGKSPKQDPAEKNDAGKSNPGQTDPGAKTTGPKEQVPDSPDARKGPADGTEEGVGKPDRDPNSKPSNAMNDKVRRDPNEKPELRPGDPKSDPADKQKEGQKSVPSRTKEQGRPSDQEESPEMKNGEATRPKPKQGESADGEKSGSDTDSKQREGGKQNKMPQESSEVPPSSEAGAKKPESNKATKKPAGETSAEPKPEEKEQARVDEKGGHDPKSATEKREGRKPSDASSDADPTDQQKSSDQQKTPDKPKSDKASNEKPPGNSDSKRESAQSDKKGGDKPDNKAGDKAGAKSDKGEGGKGKSGKGESGQSDSAKSESEDGKGDQSAGKGTEGKPSAKPGTKSGPAGTGGVSGQGESSQTQGGDTAEPAKSEEANLEYNRQATELILQKLKKDLERGDADPELLKELGWTPDEMKRFADRLSKSLNESKLGEDTAEGKARQQQFQEMLKNLDLKSEGNRRSGENEPKRDVNQIESKRSQPPAAYRSVFERFTKDLARQKTQSKDSSSK